MLDKIPNFTGEVHRGLILKPDELAKMSVGAKYEVTLHSSSSLNESKARDILEMYKDEGRLAGSKWAVMIHADVKSGADISKHVFQEFRSQKEVVLRAGTQFKVVGRDVGTIRGFEVVHVYLKETK